MVIMVSKEIIGEEIKNIKANLSCMIKKDDVPYITKAWERNFRNWTEKEFIRVVEIFIDNADIYTSFPRPYELKRIYFENITSEKEQKLKQENWIKEIKKCTPMPEKTKKALKDLGQKMLEK